MLEQAKRDQASRMDAAIADLTAEIDALQTRITSNKARLAPVRQATPAKAKTAKAKAASAEGRGVRKPRS